jgi:hypothetical protein
MVFCSHAPLLRWAGQLLEPRRMRRMTMTTILLMMKMAWERIEGMVSLQTMKNIRIRCIIDRWEILDCRAAFWQETKLNVSHMNGIIMLAAVSNASRHVTLVYTRILVKIDLSLGLWHCLPTCRDILWELLCQQIHYIPAPLSSGILQRVKPVAKVS